MSVSRISYLMSDAQDDDETSTNETGVAMFDRWDSLNSAGTTLMNRRFIIKEAVQYLSIFELEPIALISKFHSKVVKEHLADRLNTLLKNYLIRGDFARVMRKYNVVISGSGAFAFMDPAVVTSWKKIGEDIHDLDLYVKRGCMAEVVDYIRGQRGVHSEVIFSSHAMSYQRVTRQ